MVLSVMHRKKTQTTQPTSAPAVSLVTDVLPPPPQELPDKEELIEDKASQRATELAKPAWKSLETPDKTRTEVIETSAIEEPMVRETGPSLIGEMGPTLTSEPEVPRQAAKEQLAAPAQQTESPSAPKTAQLATLIGDRIPRLTLLPDWLRHLPETVATSIATPAAQPEQDESEPEPAPATEPETEPTPPPATTPALPAKAQPLVQQNGNDLWYEPETLIASLKELNAKGPAANWAAAVLQQIRALGPAIVAGSDEATAILDQLAELSRQTQPLAAEALRQGVCPKVARNRLCVGSQNRRLAAGCAGGQGEERPTTAQRSWIPRNWPTVWPKSRP